MVSTSGQIGQFLISLEAASLPRPVRSIDTFGTKDQSIGESIETISYICYQVSFHGDELDPISSELNFTGEMNYYQVISAKIKGIKFLLN